jgi:hypothetical protein
VTTSDETIRTIAAQIMGARKPGHVGPDARVWHIVLRSSSTPLRPERLASLVLDPVDVARFGLELVEKAIADSRRQWARIAIDAGYVDGWTVDVVRETGFVRSIFPGAAIAGAPQAAEA